MFRNLMPVLLTVFTLLAQPVYAQGNNDPEAVNIENGGNEGTHEPDNVNVENGGNEGTNEPSDVDIDQGGNEGMNT